MTDEQWVEECKRLLQQAWPGEPRAVIEWIARGLLRNARHLPPAEAVQLARQVYRPDPP